MSVIIDLMEVGFPCQSLVMLSDDSWAKCAFSFLWLLVVNSVYTK